MAEPFLAEIRIFPWLNPNQGWADCNGQLLPINQNQALFSLLGTQFGGNGQTNFALPDFRGRVPIHFGNNHTIGERAGQEFHTVTHSEMPAHNHFITASSAIGNSNNPNFGGTGHLLAADPGNAYSGNLTNLVTLNPGTIGTVGGSQAHENRQPYLTLRFMIALQGLFPTQN